MGEQVENAKETTPRKSIFCSGSVCKVIVQLARLLCQVWFIFLTGR